MAAPKIKKAIGNSASTTLSSSVSDSATSAPLTSDTNFNAESGEGMVMIDEGTATQEIAYSTGKIGSSLTIPLANRGLEGGSPVAHNSGATVKGILTAGMWNDLTDAFLTEHNDDGTHGSALVTSLKATGAEVTTGTEDGKFATPKAIADAKISAKRDVIIQVIDAPDSLSTGDGKAYFTVPSTLDGANLIAVHARVITAGTTNTTDIQIANVTDSVDMLSTKLTIDSTETGSDTAATPAVIDTTKDDVATNDLLRIDIDAVSTTAPKGLIVRLQFGF